MQFADFYTPIPQSDTNLLSGASGINAFRMGEQDQIAKNQRNLLKDVGGQAATGNYLQAAQTAMRGGDIDTGMALTKYKSGIDAADTDKRLKLLDFFGRGAQGADTPEKWQSLISMAQGVYGSSADLSQYGDFNKRDQVMAFLSDSKEKLERQKLQVDLEMSREKLAGEREDRGFKRDVLSNFGFAPQGATPAPSYSPPPRADAPAPSGNVTAGFAAAPSAPQPQPITPPPADSVAPPQSPQDVIAKLQPAQRAMFGLLISKGDYAGANKLLQDASETNIAAPYKGPKEKADVEEGLRKEVFATNKDYAVIRDYANKIEEIAKAPSAASDMAMIFSFMKILDPGSVVRETEYANAENARGVPETVRNMWNKVIAGQRLTNDQRKDFLTQAQTIAKAQKSQYTQSMKQYRGIANRLNLDERNVIVDLDMLKTDDVVKEARDAIKRGADPQAVKQRLIDNGIDPSGL